MPKYTYKFCDGTTSEVEVSDQQYALLKEIDARERKGNLRYRRHNSSLVSSLQKEERRGRVIDDDFTEHIE